MKHETLKRIINEFGAINVQVPLKIPERLNVLVQKKSPNARAEYIRNLIYKDCMPEILMSRLDSKAIDWISKEDQNKEIVFNCSEKIKDLKEIIELAEFSISEIQKLQEELHAAEVEYLNKISERFEKKEVSKKFN